MQTPLDLKICDPQRNEILEELEWIDTEIYQELWCGHSSWRGEEWINEMPHLGSY